MLGHWGVPIPFLWASGIPWPLRPFLLGSGASHVRLRSWTWGSAQQALVFCGYPWDLGVRVPIPWQWLGRRTLRALLFCHRGIVASILVFLCFGVTQAKDGPFSRPHPGNLVLLCVSCPGGLCHGW